VWKRGDEKAGDHIKQPLHVEVAKKGASEAFVLLLC